MHLRLQSFLIISPPLQVHSRFHVHALTFFQKPPRPLLHHTATLKATKTSPPMDHTAAVSKILAAQTKLSWKPSVETTEGKFVELGMGMRLADRVAEMMDLVHEEESDVALKM